MLIVGKWLVCDDGISRPVARVKVTGANDISASEDFLVDSAADRTVFSEALLRTLQVLGNHAPAGLSLQGVGGASPFVVVKAVLEVIRDDGGPARVNGEFAAFTDPAAIDLSILGRDVLDHFDVILSRRHDMVCLLSGSHQFQIVPG
jgi:hypothetical protein